MFRLLFSFFFVLVLQFNCLAQPAYVPDTLFGTTGFNIPRSGLFRGYETYKTPDQSYVTIGANGLLGMYIQKVKRCGSLDSSFGLNGVVSTRHKEALTNTLFGAVDTNGKIYLGGICRWSNLNYDLPYLIRFNSNGSVDEQFGDTGRVIFNVQSSVANAPRDLEVVRILPDGKILCGGGTRENFFVARLLPNGTLDNGFGTNGILYLNPTLPNQNAVATGKGFLLDDGTMVLTKRFFTGGSDVSTCLAKVKADGTFDTQVGTGGLVDLGNKSFFSFMGKLDGKIVGLQTIAGIDSTRYYFRRFNSDLSVDNNFGVQGGLRIFGIENAGNHFAVNSDGSFYLAGASFGPTGTKGIIRKYNADFSIETSFGAGGSLIYKNNSGLSSYQRASKLFLEPGNGLFTVGTTGQSGNNIMGIVYNSFVAGSNVPKLKFNNPILNCTGTGVFDWYKSNVLIPGPTGNAYQPVTSGSYKTRITDARGCSRFSNSVNVVVTAIESPRNSAISVFPNPSASGIFQVTFPEVDLALISFSVMATDGRTILSGSPSGPGFNLDLSKYPSGLYLVKVQTRSQDKIIRISK
jgi:uncharacterized delta-60 repeat protein